MNYDTLTDGYRHGKKLNLAGHLPEGATELGSWGFIGARPCETLVLLSNGRYVTMIGQAMRSCD